MSRLLFAEGAVGEIVRRIQSRLGLATADVDGWFGSVTKGAVVAFQTKRGVPASGEVDTDTWEMLMAEPIPRVGDRCLQLTAHFEGHGFGLAQGNFDGAGITWGIIGFTIQSGEIAKIVLEIQKKAPQLLEDAFGSLAPRIVEILSRPIEEQIAFGDSISLGKNKTRLAEPWLGCFARFGAMPAVQELQLRAVRTDYLDHAQKTAVDWELRTELGLALAFDIHVQNGGIKPAAAQRIRAALKGLGAVAERDLRVIVADAVANSAKPKWREDVRVRKHTIATGAGAVHGRQYRLSRWGLQELGV